MLPGISIELIVAAIFIILAFHSLIGGYRDRPLRVAFWLCAAVAATYTAPGWAWALPIQHLAFGAAGPLFVHLNLSGAITRRQAWIIYVPNLSLAAVAALFPDSQPLSGLVGVSLGISYVEWIIFSPSRIAAAARAIALAPFVALNLYVNLGILVTGTANEALVRWQVLPALVVVPLLLPPEKQ